MGLTPTTDMAKPFAASLSDDDLTEYIAKQIDSLFEDGFATRPHLKRYITAALERMEHCVVRSAFKGFQTKDGPRYYHLHTDQHAIFLYYLSNTIIKLEGPTRIAEKVYALNKALHGIDVFYEVELPTVFSLVHPVGTVLGRAAYGDYFCVYQNVTVGADLHDRHPSFGAGVVLYGGCRVIGDVHIEDNCMVSAGTSILGGNIPSGHVAFGQHPNVKTKAIRHNVIKDIFKQGN